MSWATVARAQDPEHGFADKRAVQLMDRVEAKMRAATTIEAVKRSTLREPVSGAAGGWRLLKIRVKRPSTYRVEVLDMDEKARQGFQYPFRLSDGTLRLSERFDRRDPKTGKYDPKLDPKLWQRTRYLERTGDDDIYVWDDDVQTLASLYFIDDEHPGIGHDWRGHKLSEPTFNWMRYVGAEKWQGKDYEVVEWAYDIGIHPLPAQVRYKQKIFVGRDTLVHRVVTTTSTGYVLEDQFKSIALNPVFPDSLFRIVVTDSIPKQIYDYKPRYTVGSTVPDFSLPGAYGDTVTLSRALAGKRGAILWFWGFY